MNIADGLTPETIINAISTIGTKLVTRQRKEKKSNENLKSKENPKSNKFIEQIAEDYGFTNLGLLRTAVALHGFNREMVKDYYMENDDFGTGSDIEIEMDCDEHMEINTNNKKVGSGFNEQVNFVWTEFLNKQSQCSDSTITIEHLALFLELVYENRRDFKRSVPGYLSNKGKKR